MAPRRPKQKQAARPQEPEQKKRVGRPTIFGPRLADAIVTSVRLGNYLETAAAANGINQDTLREWLKQGARELRDHEEGKDGGVEPEHVDLTVGRSKDGKDIVHRAPANLSAFSVAVSRAQAEAEEHDIALIGAAAEGEGDRPGDWRAVAWRRERKDPTRWGRRERIVVTQETKVELATELIEILRAVLDEELADPEQRKRIVLRVIERGTGEE